MMGKAISSPHDHEYRLRIYEFNLVNRYLEDLPNCMGKQTLQKLT